MHPKQFTEPVFIITNTGTTDATTCYKHANSVHYVINVIGTYLYHAE